MGEGLIDRVEEVERAAESLDQKEDEGGEQHGEHKPEPLTGAAPAPGLGQRRAAIAAADRA